MSAGFGVYELSVMSESASGKCPCLAPKKHSLELVMMWHESAPRALMATKAEMTRDPYGTIFSAKVTATALDEIMAVGSRTAR